MSNVTGWLLAIACLPVFALPVLAQSPPAFEVASIKVHPVKPGQRVLKMAMSPDAPFHIAGNRVTDEMVYLRDLMMEAYRVTDYQISGLPDWGKRGGELLDVEARTEGEKAPTQDQVRLMMQTLLADRFQLKLHHESKDLPVYELVVGKNGSKLKAAPADEREVTRGTGPANPKGTMTTPVAMLIGLLSNLVDRPILDKTGMAGSYEYPILDWVQLQRTAKGVADDTATGESVFTAVQDQLGLKLQAAKAPMDILVIDHVAKPSEN